MAGFDRTTILAGGAKIERGAYSYFTESPIVLKMSKRMFDVSVDAFDPTDLRLDERDVEVSFTPDGRWRVDEKSGLFLGGSSVKGSRWFPDADVPLVIRPLSGKPITLHNTALFKIPSLFFGATKIMMGPATFKALNINSAEWNGAASLMTVGSSGSVTDFTGYTQVDIKTRGVRGTWGSNAGFVGFNTIDGISIENELVLEPFKVDSYATVDYLFQMVRSSVKCTPTGPTEAQLLAAMRIQGGDVARGASEEGNSDDFIVKDLAGNILFTVNHCSITDGAENWGSKINRHGELTWMATREVSGSSLRPVFEIA